MEILVQNVVGLAPPADELIRPAIVIAVVDWGRHLNAGGGWRRPNIILLALIAHFEAERRLQAFLQNWNHFAGNFHRSGTAHDIDHVAFFTLVAPLLVAHCDPFRAIQRTVGLARIALDLIAFFALETLACIFIVQTALYFAVDPLAHSLRVEELFRLAQKALLLVGVYFAEGNSSVEGLTFGIQIRENIALITEETKVFCLAVLGAVRNLSPDLAPAANQITYSVVAFDAFDGLESNVFLLGEGKLNAVGV